MAEVFSPHNNVPALDVYKISGNLNLLKTSSLIMTSYLDMDEEEAEECEVYNMLVS